MYFGGQIIYNRDETQSKYIRKMNYIQEKHKRMPKQMNGTQTKR